MKCPKSPTDEHCWHVPAQDMQTVVCCWCADKQSGTLLLPATERTSGTGIVGGNKGSVVNFRERTQTA